MANPGPKDQQPQNHAVGTSERSSPSLSSECLGNQVPKGANVPAVSKTRVTARVAIITNGMAVESTCSGHESQEGPHLYCRQLAVKQH